MSVDLDWKEIVWTEGTVGGRPRIDGSRITVHTALRVIVECGGFDEALREYNWGHIDRDKLEKAVMYAAWIIESVASPDNREVLQQLMDKYDDESNEWRTKYEQETQNEDSKRSV